MLMPSVLCGSASLFAKENFSGINLGDRRREKRLVEIAELMAVNPGASIPRLMPSWSRAKCVYRLLSHSSATPDSLQLQHRDKVRAAIADAGAEGGAVLLIEDTSEMDYSGREPIEGLGPVGPGTEGRQGFLLHSVVAVRVPPQGVSLPGQAGHQPLDILGIVHQEHYIRKQRAKGERKSTSYESLGRERESELFLRSTEVLGRPPQGVEFWRVVDRAGDVFLTLFNYQIHGHDFVVRALHNRRLEGEVSKLMDYARSLTPFEGETALRLKSARGRAARDVQLRLAAAPVTLSISHLPRAAREQLGAPLAPLKCTIVRVYEENPPEPAARKKPGTKMEKDRRPSERIEWFLLTSATVETFEQAQEVAARYSARWVIEEFHRALKEGMGAERLQLQSKNGLMAAVAIMSIAALRLVALKERVRITPEAPASEAELSELELRVLEHETKRKIQTVRDVTLAIGRLGGHLNRKSDGLPGYRTMMQGLQRLLYIVRGVEIALASMKNRGS